jgi:hypothetical protein
VNGSRSSLVADGWVQAASGASAARAAMRADAARNARRSS